MELWGGRGFQLPHPDMEAAVEEPPRARLSWYAILVFASAAPVARLRAPNTAACGMSRWVRHVVNGRLGAGMYETETPSCAGPAALERA